MYMIYVMCTFLTQALKLFLWTPLDYIYSFAQCCLYLFIFLANEQRRDNSINPADLLAMLNIIHRFDSECFKMYSVILYSWLP